MRCSIHERMRKPHFGAVDCAIAGALDDGKHVMVFRVEDDALGGSLCRGVSEMGSAWCSSPAMSSRSAKIAP